MDYAASPFYKGKDKGWVNFRNVAQGLKRYKGVSTRMCDSKVPTLPPFTVWEN